jgi:dihydroneopterin aldolase/2-amino-4-hydroxy-6-hydroxymethyldihydropteridine diphosphokinase
MISYLGLGSNIGNKSQNLETAIKHINLLENTKIIETAKFITTKPYGYENQDYFVNSVIKIETQFSPQTLLSKILEIELKMGRVRKIHWGPRIIDIDILYYEDLIIDDENLKIPHPEIPKREFILKSLLEICPDKIDPKLNKTVKTLWRELNG